MAPIFTHTSMQCEWHTRNHLLCILRTAHCPAEQRGQRTPSHPVCTRTVAGAFGTKGQKGPLLYLCLHFFFHLWWGQQPGSTSFLEKGHSLRGQNLLCELFLLCSKTKQPRKRGREGLTWSCRVPGATTFPISSRECFRSMFMIWEPANSLSVLPLAMASSNTMITSVLSSGVRYCVKN